MTVEGALDLLLVAALQGLALLAVFLVVASAASLLLAVHPHKFRSSVTPADYGWRYEAVTLRTADGLALAAWYIPGVSNAPDEAVVVLHGYPFDKGNVLSVTPSLHERYDLLLFDFRSFGRSEGWATTFGAREDADVRAAVEHLEQERGKKHVALYGFSLGASVALLAAAQEGSVRAVVADSPFASLELLARDNFRHVPLFQHPLAWLTLLFARVYPGVDPGQVSPADAARAWKGPVLLIHGAADSQITLRHAEALQAALAPNPRAEVWLVPGADHGEAWARNRVEYERRVLEFLGRNLDVKGRVLLP